MRLTALAGLLALAFPLYAAPDVAEILQRFAERGENAELAARRNGISYQRVSRVEYLEDDGKVKRDEIRIYQIVLEDGEPVTRLVSVNGRPAREKAGKKRSAARETGDKSRSLILSDDLLSRFDFTLLREERFAHRPAWVLGFVPRGDAPKDDFLDKLINAMSGTLWIDQEDCQMAKAEIRLSKRVSFFGGLAGAIDKLDLTLIQKRIEPEVWLGEAVHIDFAGRKLFSGMRFRCFENCSGFERVPGEQARAEMPVNP